MTPPEWRSRAPLGHGRPLSDADHKDEPPRKKRAETMTRLDHKRETSRIIFNKTISGRYQEGDAGFEEVGVLLITWRDDDLFCRDSEVPRLRDIFADKFGYTVREYEIPSKRSATGLASALASFAYDFDSPNKMAIVYYGGHGDFVENRLQLFAREQGDGELGDPTTFFDDALHQLKLPDTDILVIVDCCYAARAFSRTEMGRRKFELLTATPPLAFAPSPGKPGSFTTALCNAFDNLLETDKRGFTTAKLYRQVFFAQNDTRKPFLFDQSRYDYGKIWLKPFERGSSQSGQADSDTTPGKIQPEAKVRRYYVDLRLQMSCMPDPLKMNQLATSMQYLPHVKELRFQHLHAPEEELEEFMNGIRKAAVLRPLVVRLRHRRAMKELQQRQTTDAQNDGLEPASVPHPSMHTKPADRSMYDWGDSFREPAQSTELHDVFTNAPDDIDEGDIVHPPA